MHQIPCFIIKTFIETDKFGNNFFQVRINAANRLLEIRDDIIEIVLFLKANQFGGRNFKWNAETLEKYDITLPKHFRIPKAFQDFAEITPLDDDGK